MKNFRPGTEGRRGLFVRWRDGFCQRYRSLACKSWFTRAIAAFFIVQFVGSVSVVLTVMFDPGEILNQLGCFGFSDWMILASNIISALYITWGVFLLRRSRLRAWKL